MEHRAPFGTLLREFRLAAGFSQEALAERALLSVDGIGALERGVRRAPHRQTLALLAEGLGLAVADRARLEEAAARSQPMRRRIARTDDVVEDLHNLPFPLTRFFGRERETAAVRSMMAEHRLVTLAGVGGVGKTRLALEIARGLVGEFSDGIWFVELAPLVEPGLLDARFAAVVGMTPDFAAARSDAWIGQFAHKRFLIIFDNCEHLLGAAAGLVQRLLQRCPGVRVLATSREPLRVAGENVHRLEALELPAIRRGALPKLDDLRDSPAIKMFFDRARDAAPSFRVDDGDDATWRAVGTVCTRLDGIPFAIELAAARMSSMSLDMLARGLDRRFDLLTAGSRTALPRHQTLRALLDWSYDMLADDERRVLRRLAVFSGGWTAEAAEAVCTSADVAAPRVLPTLVSLVDKSLVVADTSATVTRYGMLETTRAYALERLVDDAENEAVSLAHARYFLQLYTLATASWGSSPGATWLAPLELELDNVRAALHWALAERTRAPLAAKLAKAQHGVLELLSLFGEGVQSCERALAALGSDSDPRLEAPLQIVLGKFYARGGYAARGLAAATRAVDLYRTLWAQNAKRKDRATLAVALGLVGRHLAFLGRNDDADRSASEAVAIAREAADPSAIAWTLYVKSLTIAASDLPSRRALLEEALRCSRGLPPETVLGGVVLLGLGHAEFDAGEYARAREHARDALEHYRLTGRNEDLAIWALSLSAVAASAAGDLDAAFVDAKEALFQAHGWLDVTCAIEVVANVSALRGHARVAAHLLGASGELFSEMVSVNIPFPQILRDRTFVELRKTVSEDELAAWIAEGERWSFDRVVATARGLS